MKQIVLDYALYSPMMKNLHEFNMLITILVVTFVAWYISRVHHHVDGIVLLHCIYHGDVTEHTKLLSTNQLVYMRTRFKTRCILLLHVQNFLKCSWVVKLVQRMTHTCTNQLIKRLYVLLYVPACWRPSGTYLSCTGIDRRICLWGE